LCAADDGADSKNTIFPRRKAGEQTRVNSKPVVLNDTILRQLFTLPLHEAAVRLGISATAMKSACRKLGIKKWPYRSSYGIKSGGASRSIANAGSGSDTTTFASPCSSSVSTSVGVSRFPGADSLQGSNSGGSSPRNEPITYRNDGMDERDSLARDAALLAETVLMLQQGSSIQSSAASGSHSPGGSSTSSSARCGNFSSSNASSTPPPPTIRARVSQEKESKKRKKPSKHIESSAACQRAGNPHISSSSSCSSSSSSHTVTDYSPRIQSGQMMSHLNVSALSANPALFGASGNSGSALSGVVSGINSASHGATASVASLLN